MHQRDLWETPPHAIIIEHVLLMQLEIVLPQIPQIFIDFFQICLLLTYLFFTFAADNKKERMRNMEKLEDTS